jgi:preprotein translocase SecE subunit
LAKTVDTAKKTAPEDVLGDEISQDTDSVASADSVDEEEDLSLEVDPTARDEEPRAVRALAPARGGAPSVSEGTGGIYVPPALLGNPITRWLAESYIELRKVTWPEPRDAWNMSLVVIVVSVVMALALAATDFGLGHLLSYFVSLGLGK